MSSRTIYWRSIGFWVGLVLLLGSLLLAAPLLLAGMYFPPLLLLVLLLAVGLLLGIVLIVAGTQSLGAKLLALLSPVLGPVLFLVVASWNSPAPYHDPEHLVFLIPVDFRGVVVVVQDDAAPHFASLAKGDITLPVPAGGLLTSSAQFTSTKLAEADYYLVNAAGQRLAKLRQLQVPQDPGDKQPARREIGVFREELYYKRRATYAADPSRFPPQEVACLSFTVACFDSLDTPRMMRKPSF